MSQKLKFSDSIIVCVFTGDYVWGEYQVDHEIESQSLTVKDFFTKVGETAGERYFEAMSLHEQKNLLWQCAEQYSKNFVKNLFESGHLEVREVLADVDYGLFFGDAHIGSESFDCIAQDWEECNAGDFRELPKEKQLIFAKKQISDSNFEGLMWHFDVILELPHGISASLDLDD